MPATPDNHPRPTPPGKRPWRKPEFFSEDLFESKAMACGKQPTGQPSSDCEDAFGLTNNVS